MGRGTFDTKLETQTQFYLTAPAPCPYLQGNYERKIFAHLVGPAGRSLNNSLTQLGFRRSQNIVYRPACDGCAACISVRVLVDGFNLTRSFKRVLSRNTDLTLRVRPANATSEQYEIFRRYLYDRHRNGDMAEMTLFDYKQMIENGTTDSHLAEYRLIPKDDSHDTSDGMLLGVALTDQLQDGLSMIYSFYDVCHYQRGLGTYMVLDHVLRTIEMGLPYLYLGYWIKGSQKMDYKSRFTPQEHLIGKNWARVS
jgi:arginyl-tRNA--protein-N-Asp/Glu arginylyltransferase